MHNLTCILSRGRVALRMLFVVLAVGTLVCVTAAVTSAQSLGHIPPISSIQPTPITPPGNPPLEIAIHTQTGRQGSAGQSYENDSSSPDTVDTLPTYAHGEDWVGITPAEFTLNPGQSTTITYSCDATSLAPGTYSADLIQSDSSFDQSGNPSTDSMDSVVTCTVS